MNKILKNILIFMSGTLISLMLLVFCMSAGYISLGSRGILLDSDTFKKIEELNAYIERFSIYEPKTQDKKDYLFKGLVSSTKDPYSTYYTKKELEQVESRGKDYVGIGIKIVQLKKTNEFIVNSVFDNSPAKKAGVISGDIITKVNGKSVLDYSIEELASNVRGKAGTKVKITISRDGKEKTLVMVRAKVKNKTVEYEKLSNDIGYIRITEFDEPTSKQYIDAINSLEKSKVKGLIVDLRDNGGGYLDSVLEMLDRMIKSGTLVSSIDKNGEKQEFKTRTTASYNKPVIILVNEFTASASELYSAAMRELNGAILIGTNTFGKGIVQSTFKLSDGSAIKLTTSKYYTPKGINFHDKGLKPDIEIKPDKNYLKIKMSGKEVSKEDDNVLKRAIEEMKKRIR